MKRRAYIKQSCEVTAVTLQLCQKSRRQAYSSMPIMTLVAFMTA